MRGGAALGISPRVARSAVLVSAVLEVDVGEAEAAADDPAVAEGAADLAGRGRGGDVEVLGLAAHQEVADAAPHQVGGVIEAGEAADDFHRVGVEVVLGDGLVDHTGSEMDRRGCRRNDRLRARGSGDEGGDVLEFPGTGAKRQQVADSLQHLPGAIYQEGGGAAGTDCPRAGSPVPSRP